MEVVLAILRAPIHLIVRPLVRHDLEIWRTRHDSNVWPLPSEGNGRSNQPRVSAERVLNGGRAKLSVERNVQQYVQHENRPKA
jgi:hypothetical protein